MIQCGLQEHRSSAAEHVEPRSRLAHAPSVRDRLLGLKDTTHCTATFDGTTTEKADVNDGVSTVDKAGLS